MNERDVSGDSQEDGSEQGHVPESHQEIAERLDRLWARSTIPHLTAGQTAGSVAGQMISHFQVQKVLGSGSFGVVYLAHDTQLDRPVALKIPRPEVLFDQRKRERFTIEAALAAKLEHGNIVPVYEADLAGPVPFLASAFCDGPNLGEWIAEQKELPGWKAVVELIARVADAVQHAHQQGVFHRDLKPANILLVRNKTGVSGDGALNGFSPKLTDFGLAKLSNLSMTETRSSMMVGTPQYMAPEQIETGIENRDSPATDIYSLGVILFEMLTGHLPQDGKNYVEILDNIRSKTAIRLRRIRPDLPRQLEQVCERCLEKNPRARYATVAELGSDLRRCLLDQPIAGNSYRLTNRISYWCSRPKRIAEAGWFAVWSHLILALWTIVAVLMIPLYVPLPSVQLYEIYFDLCTVVVTTHVVLVWLGWQTVCEKRWAIWAGLIWTAMNIPFLLWGMIRGPIMFEPMFRDHNEYFSFSNQVMVFAILIVNLFLFGCAAIASHRIKRRY